ncbi:disintegrin and metalloproteinase domain-containing protein 10-like [Amblyomma americanum]
MSWLPLTSGTEKLARCPEALPKDDMTECNSGTQVCRGGRCQGSICEKFGYEDCQRVSTGAASHVDMCLVDCKRKGTDGPCLGPCITSGLEQLCGRKRERGAACNQNRGYCDVFRRCRTVDEGGALTRLEQLLVPNKVREWIKAYRWAVVLAVFFFLLGILLFIRCCAVLTPTNNPRLPKAKSFKESVRSPMKFLKEPRPGFGVRWRDTAPRSVLAAFRRALEASSQSSHSPPLSADRKEQRDLFRDLEDR